MTPQEEAIFLFLKERTAPAPTSIVAKRFILSDSKVTSLLEGLVTKGLLEAVKAGKHRLYKVKP
jgi:predicted transcriptional regulator